MKLENNHFKVEIHGNKTESTGFNIQMNSKAFKVLSSTLYENKIGAIVRELSTNAYDSHVMAGKTNVPFIIHLPDAFNPYFSVQDFGVGMSTEDINTVFISYFSSTKDQSNDCTGMLGLGAKTPFSYTDQFTVTSVKNNVRSIYNAFINEQGIPNIVEMFSEETTDDNGVEIKLSVKREDYSKFSTEVANQLKYFKVKPLLQNTTSTGFPDEPEYLFNTPNISIEKHTGSYYGTSGVVALQGNVGYTLDLNQLRDKISAENYQMLFNLNKNKSVLKFNIGEIGVTASREGVEYTKTTTDNINKKIDLARQDISVIVEDKLLKEFKTDYERAVYLNSDDIVRMFSSNVTIPNAEVTSAGSYFFNLNKFLMTSTKVVTGSVTYSSRGKQQRRSMSSTLAATFVPLKEDQIMIVFKNKSTLYSKKIQHLFNTFPKLQQVYCIEMYDKVYTQALTDGMQKFLGGFTNIHMLSDVVLPVAVREQHKRQSSIPKYYAHVNSRYDDVRSYQKVFTDLSEIKTPTVYFVVENLSPTYETSNVEMLQQLSTFSKVLPVIAVRESAVEKLKLNSMFIPLSKYIKDEQQKFNTAEVKREMNRRFIIDSVSSSISYQVHNKKELIKKHCPENEIARLFNTLDAQKKKYEKQYDSNFKRFIGYNPEQSSQVRTKMYSAINVVKNILNKYAVVGAIGNSYGNKEISDEHLVIYLNAVQLYSQN